MKQLAIIITNLVCASLLFAQDIQLKVSNLTPYIELDKQEIFNVPPEGLWSIATAWENEWPANWKHASPTKFEKSGDWEILSGRMELPEGHFLIRDAYRLENNRIKCVRRFEWKGEQTLDSITLSVRWQVKAQKPTTFLPGIIY